MSNAPPRRPERKAVVEGIRVLIFELNCPGGPAVLCVVDAKVCRVPGSSNRHQVSNAGAESLHIAELQCFGARHYTGSPRLSPVRRDGERAGATGCPDHLWVHPARPRSDRCWCRCFAELVWVDELARAPARSALRRRTPESGEQSMI